jgi:hypothetical protein
MPPAVPRGLFTVILFLRDSTMPLARFQRRTAWFVLASYLLAGIAAESVHRHGHDALHAPCLHGQPGLHGQSDLQGQPDACDTAAAGALPDVHQTSIGWAASDSASDEDGCVICRFLGQLRFAPQVAASSIVCRLVTMLASAPVPSGTSEFSAAPYSRGPPQSV